MTTQTVGAVMRQLPVLLSLLGCAMEPATDTPYAPYPEYRGWWEAVEACSGRWGDLSRVSWFTRDINAREAGYTLGDRIWIVEPYQQNRLVVQHEMLHVLTGSDHEGEEWQRCKLHPLTVAQVLAEQPR